MQKHLVDLGYWLIGSVGGTSVVLLVAAWLFRASLKEWLNRETEVFKNRLRADSDKEIAKFNSLLNIAATEHQVMFTKMHEKRALVVEELHVRLTRLRSKAEAFVLSSDGNEVSLHNQNFESMRKEVIEYLQYFEETRIYLPTNLCEKLSQHVSKINRAVHLAGAYGGKDFSLIPHLDRLSHETFLKVYSDFSGAIPESQAALEDEFRKMLGVK